MASTTTKTIRPAPVRRAIEVNAPPAKAFDVFTRKTSAWWPKQHHIGKSPLLEAIIEPKVDGRWFERGEDGTECQWGRVLAWKPPHSCGARASQPRAVRRRGREGARPSRRRQRLGRHPQELRRDCGRSLMRAASSLEQDQRLQERVLDADRLQRRQGFEVTAAVIARVQPELALERRREVRGAVEAPRERDLGDAVIVEVRIAQVE